MLNGETVPTLLSSSGEGLLMTRYPLASSMLELTLRSVTLSLAFAALVLAVFALV